MSNSARLLAGFREVYLDSVADDYDRILQASGSPIEQIMIGFLFCRGFSQVDMAGMYRREKSAQKLGMRRPMGRTMLKADDVLWEVILQPTIEFDGFVITPDFGLIESFTSNDETPAAVAVELDGHDFHERTKEQASRDKKRDRALLSRGWSTIRFTGSEVVRDPDAVYADWHAAMVAECEKRGRGIQ